jgi:hypothetical protein
MGVAPLLHQSIYFAIAAAVTGVTGAMGITAGGFLATVTNLGGLPAVFALSAVLRLAALVPWFLFTSSVLCLWVSFGSCCCQLGGEECRLNLETSGSNH